MFQCYAYLEPTAEKLARFAGIDYKFPITMRHVVQNPPQTNRPHTPYGYSRRFTGGIPTQLFVPWILAGALVGFLPKDTSADPFERTLHLGAHLGYSTTFIDDKTAPHSFNGAAFGLQALYGINRYVGICLDAAVDWHANHRRYRWGEVEEDDEIAMSWVPGPAVSSYLVTTAALSVVYAVDITRMVPYLAAGITGMRIDRNIDAVHNVEYGAGVRLGGGLDYYFERLSAGIGVTADQIFGGNSDHELRVLFLLRLSFLIRL